MRPFRVVGFPVLWSGLSMSIIGDQLFAVVFTWIAVQSFGGSAGYLSALRAAILFGAAVLVGRWTDGRDQRQCMIVADLSRAAVLTLVVAAWIHLGSVNVWMLIVALIGLGCGEAVFRPALQAVVPDIVTEPRTLPAANALLDATGRAARLAGPAMIVPLAMVLPLKHFLSVDAFTFLLSASAVLLIGRSRTPPRGAREKQSIVASFAHGFQATRHHPVLSYTLATYGVLNAAWNTVYYLALPMLLITRQVKGPGDSGIGALALIISVYGGANLASTLMFGNRDMPRRPQFQIFGGSLVIGSGLILLLPVQLVPHDWLLPCYLAVAAITAIGGPMKDIPFAVLRQTAVPREDVPAAMRAYLIVHSTGMLLGWLLMPSLIALIGPAGVIAFCGAATLGVGLIGLTLFADWREPGRHVI